MLAEDGHELWLRYPPVHGAMLDPTVAAARSWSAIADSPTLKAAVEELRRAMPGLLAAPLPMAIRPNTGRRNHYWHPEVFGSHCPTTIEFESAGPRRVPHPQCRRRRTPRHRHRRQRGSGRVVRCICLAASHADAPAPRAPQHPVRSALDAPHPGSLGQSRRLRSNAATPAHPCGTGRSCPTTLAPLYRLRTRLRIARNQRHRAHQRQCQRLEPHARLLEKGRGPGRCVQAIRLRVLSERTIQRRQWRSAACRPPIRWIPRCAPGGEPRPMRFIATSPISAAFWSRPMRRVSRARRITADLTPTAPTCSPTRLRRARRHRHVARVRVFAGQPADRATQAYAEFAPLDGKFRDNVLLQIKNGPIDFQPREPFHPLFGAMPKTTLMLEVQITKEYLGFATHLAYLGPLWQETLHSDTYAKAYARRHKVIAVAHAELPAWPALPTRRWTAIGPDRISIRPTGMRLAGWHGTRASIPRPSREEWVRMTFSNDPRFVAPVVDMMMGSREAVVNYMTPLGLHHQMARGPHYGPGPWVSGGPRADWTSVYYNRADSQGIGFDRTSRGSNACRAICSASRCELRGCKPYARESAALVSPPSLGLPIALRRLALG